MKKKFIAFFVACNLLIANMLFLTGCDDVTNSANNSNSANNNSATTDDESFGQILDETFTDDYYDEVEEVAGDLVETDDSIIGDSTSLEWEIVTPQLVNMENFEFVGIDELENETKGWGQGLQVDEFNRPISSDIYQEKYMQYEAYFIMPNVEGEQKMYLTFDQGYENGYTSMILDSLLEKDCPAVFFLTLPYATGNPDLVQRMVDEGHVLANHSVKHLSTPSLTPQEQAEEILLLHNYIIEEYNYEMDLFRPPMGEWSTQSLEITRQLGYKTIFWSYAYRDWEVDNQMGVETAFPLVTGAAHNGGLYLLHSVSADNAHMLGDVIDTIRAEGYEFCALDFDNIVFTTPDDDLDEDDDSTEVVQNND